MEPPVLVLDAAGVAALLGRDEAWFRRKRRALERDHAFPRPLPGVGLRWSRRLVERWIATNGMAAANDVAPPADGVRSRYVA